MAITSRDALTTVRARTVHADWDDTGSTAQTEHEQRAVSWLLRVRQLQGQGLDFDSANAQAIAEDDARGGG